MGDTVAREASASEVSGAKLAEAPALGAGGGPLSVGPGVPSASSSAAALASATSVAASFRLGGSGSPPTAMTAPDTACPPLGTSHT